MKKYICCVHDKKSDTYDGFMLFPNISAAIRSFQMSCEQNDVFKKWPEDFQFVLVAEIPLILSEINEKNEVIKEAEIAEIKQHNTVIAEAKDFVKKNESLHVDLDDVQSAK